MPLFWFLAGILTTIAVLALLSPWVKTLSRLAAFTATPARAGASAAVLLAALVGLYEGLGHPQDRTTPPMSDAARPAAGMAPAGNPAATEIGSTPFGAAAKVFGDTTGANPPMGATAVPGVPAGSANAGSMDSAVANLEARLAKGGGTPGDWELLAKSFEFLSRPDDAAKARAHQLPSLNARPAGAPSPESASSAAVAVSGEVTLDAALRAKAATGDTLFIIAKSVDSPGVPVAVIRGSVGTWPVKFILDDSQSMIPGRTLSSVGPVTIEARISKKGQPLPSAGDLQGSSGAIDPAGHRPLQIKIDHVIS